MRTLEQEIERLRQLIEIYQLRLESLRESTGTLTREVLTNNLNEYQHQLRVLEERRERERRAAG